MRTTLKRGVGQSSTFEENGDGAANGHGSTPTGLGPITVYRSETAPVRTRRRLAVRIAGWTLFVLSMVIAGIGGGTYLYLHETVAAVAPRSPADRKVALEKLKVPIAGEPAIALVIGYDRRANEAADAPSRSDTLMLVRADPGRKSVSLLSLPRDLRAEIRCPGQAPYRDKINAAFSRCGTEGTVETVKALTGLPINYLITVNFRGFRQLVDKLGGVWMDIDHRYFNDQGGGCAGCYAVIDLQPGYQRLKGMRALDFVRFRHTDSDLHRNARQQLFVRAFKDQIRSSISITKLPQVINVITKNVEVSQGGGKDVTPRTVLSYAALLYSLPAGGVSQSRIEGLEGPSDLTTSSENIQKAVEAFAHPDVEAPQKANSVALGEKPKVVKAPPPKDTAIAVLNGNGITGSASQASYLLSRRGYRMVYPANGVPANAPTFDYFRTVVFHDPKKPGSEKAARKVVALFGSAGVRPFTPAIASLSNGAMLVTVVGQTFHGRLAAAPVDATPEKQVPNVTPRQDGALGLLRDVRARVPFPLYVPKLIERNSRLSSTAIRDYLIDPDKKHRAVRLIYNTGGNEYWGIQETDWKEAPILSAANFTRKIGDRRYEMHYNGARLHMIVLRTNRATYWVVNTLLDSLSNETMIAIAKSLRPIGVVTE
jgi:polyisoprenyl-teichoic acid--peptidoglycan teichoic acid transferase